MSTATLYIEKKKAFLPRLRFQEFEGEWKEILLEDFAKRGSGHTPNKSHPEYYNGDINWISLTDSKRLDNGYIEFTNTKITQLGLDNSSAILHPAGSVLLSRDAGVGKSAVMKHPMAVSQHFIVWTIKENLSSNWFLYNVLQIMKPEFERIAIGNTIKTIGLPYFKKLKIAAPSFPEQKKIASFLNAVDEKVQQLSRKKVLLEQYKKGIMQQLFYGKLRFKDENGEDYPDWEEKKLGDVAIKKSSNISANKIEENFGDFIIYGASGVLKKVDFYKEEKDYISIVKDGAGVGRLLYCKGKSSVLGTMEVISPKQNIDSYFLYCLLLNIDFKKYITGSTIPHIYFKDYSIESCGIPSIPEQQKIANFLSSIDTKIESTNQEITQTQTFKKGLLQQMFV
ncbi:restriction endonuclease subunit S [Flavobacterium sp. C3NV]|uniref:restriction endonuclease subunit S n=1 Tax=Flavobacterium sp. C3NV TaxID=3393358 RepID=UPI0039901024